jgi:transcriptional regulator GlxA family with amidase domain
MPSNPDRFPVVVVALDRVIPFHLSVPCIVFGDSLPDGYPVEVVVCAGEPGELSTSAGVGLSGLAPLDVLHEADAIVVPGWRDLAGRPPERLLDALRTADRRGAARRLSACALARRCLRQPGCSKAGAPPPTGRARAKWPNASRRSGSTPMCSTSRTAIF